MVYRLPVVDPAAEEQRPEGVLQSIRLQQPGDRFTNQVDIQFVPHVLDVILKPPFEMLSIAASDSQARSYTSMIHQLLPLVQRCCPP